MKCAFLHWINVVLNQVVIFVRAVFGKYFNTQEIKCRFFEAKFSFKFPWSLILSENKTNHLTTVRAAPFKWRKKLEAVIYFASKFFIKNRFHQKKLEAGFFFVATQTILTFIVASVKSRWRISWFAKWEKMDTDMDQRRGKKLNMNGPRSAKLIRVT